MSGHRLETTSFAILCPPVFPICHHDYTCFAYWCHTASSWRFYCRVFNGVWCTLVVALCGVLRLNNDVFLLNQEPETSAVLNCILTAMAEF
ncbi:hypothetical protein OUZ56_007281 [Daphnia magna]|uniref:Uncharacterized protein n=1 Tax=Daphnia magna TaxID=35525 RepID=A0ABQ9YY56_9CRUS|nr:hypothetical protein OUZ56_007281 [Daphnia magna]